MTDTDSDPVLEIDTDGETFADIMCDGEIVASVDVVDEDQVKASLFEMDRYFTPDPLDVWFIDRIEDEEEEENDV